jgi:hypothetical protein
VATESRAERERNRQVGEKSPLHSLTPVSHPHMTLGVVPSEYDRDVGRFSASYV